MNFGKFKKFNIGVDNAFVDNFLIFSFSLGVTGTWDAIIFQTDVFTSVK